jgi:hypothetical protein
MLSEDFSSKSEPNVNDVKFDSFTPVAMKTKSCKDRNSVRKVKQVILVFCWQCRFPLRLIFFCLVLWLVSSWLAAVAQTV